MHQLKRTHQRHHQSGFTLLELLVVVSILAAMAGIATSAVDGYNQRAQEELVHVEMSNIADAIYKFKRDTGYFPKTGVYPNNAANLSQKGDFKFLLEEPSVGQVWSVETGIGWKGPYMEQTSSQRLHNGGDCANTNNVVTISNSVVAFEDPFARNIDYNASPTNCFAIHDDGFWVAKKYSGQAYQYLIDFDNSMHPDCVDGTTTCIALLSAGKNGKAEDGEADDIVKVLKVNP